MTISASANSKMGFPGNYAPGPGAIVDPKASVSPAAHQTPPQDLRKTRERIVVMMMMIVSAAIAAMFHMHLGYSVLWAGVLGCAFFAGFMALHTLRSRASQIARLRNDVSRLEQEVGRLRPQAPTVSAISGIAAMADTKAHEAGNAKIRTNPSAPSQSSEPLRTPPSASKGGSSPALGQTLAPAADRPENTEPATERISPDARWEAPGFNRTVKPTPKVNLETAGQGAAQEQTALKADRFATAAAAASPRTGAPPAKSEFFEAPSWSGTSIASTDPLRDAWSFRPKEAVEARSFAPDSGAAEEAALRTSAALGTVPAQSHQPRGIEADLEMVQRKIKAMAEEVNAAEAVRMKLPAEPERTISTTPQMMGSGYASSSTAADFGTAAMAIEDGISALKHAAGTMRSPASAQVERRDSSTQAAASGLLPPADLLIPSTAQTIAVSSPLIPAPAVPDLQQTERLSGSAALARAHQPMAARAFEPTMPEVRIPEANAPEIRDSRVTEIAKAIEAKRMNVLLSPIVGLGDYAVTHFEVVVRLHNADGTHLDRQEEALTLAGNHLLALFDAERLSRTAAVAELLQSRGKNGAVLTAASGASMSDANFLETFARVYETRNSISGQLVLTFSQADVEAFGSGTWQAISDMHSFGFRFALDHVTHLGMDFEHLAQCGFTFVKLPAQVFLKGLPSDSGFITVNDICRHLARCGLTLVVESVDDEALLARVFGFGALFGQGQLFGAPREISLDALTPSQSAAA